MTLRALPARTIVRAIAGAARRWRDADFAPRAQLAAAVAARTGYARSAVEYAFDALFAPMTEAALLSAIASELGCVEALDGFVGREGRPAAWAAPIGRVCVIASRTTIGVALPAAAFALCAKCELEVKDREDGLVAAFFRTLAAELPQLAGAARARPWSSVEASVQDLASFDAVVAFGRTETLATVRSACAPQARFVGYGSRASAGYVCAETLSDELRAEAVAAGAARDLVLYDSEGCLSLHALFAERGGGISPFEFAGMLGRAARCATLEFPAAQSDPAVLAARGAARDLAEFRAAAGTGAAFANEAVDYAILFDPPREAPPLFIPRTLGVIPVEGPAEALEYLQRHGLELEGFALSEPRPDLVRLATDAGAVRLTRFGELQRPPIGGNHGGRPRVVEFVRWIDNEL